MSRRVGFAHTSFHHKLYIHKKLFFTSSLDSLQFVSHIKKHQDESLVIGRHKKLVHKHKRFECVKSDERFILRMFRWKNRTRFVSRFISIFFSSACSKSHETASKMKTKLRVRMVMGTWAHMLLDFLGISFVWSFASPSANNFQFQFSVELNVVSFCSSPGDVAIALPPVQQWSVSHDENKVKALTL